MVQLTSFVSLALVASSVLAAPVQLNKRIAQVIAESTQKWEQACLKAGGADKCNPVSIAAFSTLLAAPGPCEQQNQADNMIDLAKTLKSDPEMIRLTKLFAQQPRNTPNSLSTPYCQQAPKNAELNGLFQCQFQGANAKTFVGNLAVGAPGTIPFGLKQLNPAGSCPAHPQGPIADGTQLNALVSDPGKPGAGAGAGGAGAGSASSTKAPAKAQSSAEDSDNEETMDGDSEDDDAAAAPAEAAQSNNAAATPTPAPAASSSNATGGDFHKKNAADATALNAKFATLSASSPCKDGENACVDGGFAQCVGGKFVVAPCAGTLKCQALPLVLKAGTSIACTTEADAQQRIKDSAAQ